METNRYNLRPFHSKAPPAVQDAAFLHAQLLPHSPVVKLGNEFMQQFYYRFLPAENFIFGCIAYVGDEPAGFVSISDDAGGFMPKALRKHAPRVAFTILRSVLASPRRMINVWEAWRIMQTRSHTSGVEDCNAEILSIGVLPKYRSKEFIRETGLKIALYLMDYALSELSIRGALAVRAIVDIDNAKARAYYEKNRWKPGHTHVPGWRKPSMEYIRRLEDLANRQTTRVPKLPSCL